MHAKSTHEANLLTFRLNRYGDSGYKLDNFFFHWPTAQCFGDTLYTIIHTSFTIHWTTMFLALGPKHRDCRPRNTAWPEKWGSPGKITGMEGPQQKMLFCATISFTKKFYCIFVVRQKLLCLCTTLPKSRADVLLFFLQIGFTEAD